MYSKGDSVTDIKHFLLSIPLLCPDNRAVVYPAMLLILY